MDAHDGGQNEQNGDDMSPDGSKLKLQLPMSVDPPSAANPAKQMVWIVSDTHIF